MEMMHRSRKRKILGWISTEDNDTVFKMDKIWISIQYMSLSSVDCKYTPLNIKIVMRLTFSVIN